MTSRLLEIENLNVRLAAGKAARPILDGVSLHVERGETVGLVGESGSGKSVTCRSVLGLLPEETEAAGSVRVDGEDVLTMSSTRLRDLRRRDVSMIFQDPRASINPLRRIGDYVTEGMRAAGCHGRTLSSGPRSCWSRSASVSRARLCAGTRMNSPGACCSA